MTSGIYLRNPSMKTGKHMLGRRLSEETKKKISEGQMGADNQFYGKHHTPESIEKIRKAKIGTKASEETKTKMSETHKRIGTGKSSRGRKHSVKTIRKMELSRKGRPNPSTSQRLKGMSGEKNYNWKGGITTIAAQIRASEKYKEWRTHVFTRDNFTCQICGIRGQNLNADHIEAFSILLRKHGITNVQTALICTDLWDIANGRTLCLECHKKTPTFGCKLHMKIINETP